MVKEESYKCTQFKKFNVNEKKKATHGSAQIIHL